MTKNAILKSKLLPATLIGLAIGLGVAACGSKTETQPAADTAAADAAAREQQLAAREQEVAQKEAAIAAKAKEEADQKAAEAAEKERLAAEKVAAAKKSSSTKSSSTKSTSSGSSTAAVTPAPAPKPVPKPIDVPAGTQLNVALSSDLSSKTAKAGDPFEARLTSPVTVDGRVAVPSGTRVSGTITDVVSGSKAIGAVPMLGLKFDTLVMENGQQIPINGELNEQGKSEKVRDTAKILGGAAAGAILGHQVKKGSGGKVIGGLLGGAVGAVAAKKTGTEVTLASGSPLTISLGAGFRVEGR